MSAADRNLKSKVILERYRVVDELARGGMGVVYLGRSEGAAGFQRPVVIKRLKEDAVDMADAGAMFIREARLLSYLQHSNIVSIVDFGEQDGELFMVLEYVHGFHLGQWYKDYRLRKTRFDADIAIEVTAQVLDALHYAHTLQRGEQAMQVVHRDVSPSNVLIDINGRVHLADFGIARALGAVDEFKTQTPMLKGKLAYMTPELFEGKPPSPSSDAYAAAVGLYEGLTGRNPFAAATMPATMQRVLEAHAPPVTSIRDDVPERLDVILGRALDKGASRRYQSAGQLASDLRTCLSAPVDQVRARLAQLAERDFTDEMATRLKVLSLSARDRMWQAEGQTTLGDAARQASFLPPVLSELSSPAAKGVVPAEAAPSKDSPSEQLVAASSGTNAAVVGRPSLALLAAVVGLLGVLIAVAAGWFFLRDASDESQASRYIVVSSRDEPGTQRVVPIGGTQLPGPSSAAVTDVLRSSFAKRLPEVARCFEGAPEDVRGREIGLVFDVRANGSVANVAMSPPEIASSDLGQCIHQVAVKTQFAQIGADTTFRIPLRISND